MNTLNRAHCLHALTCLLSTVPSRRSYLPPPTLIPYPIHLPSKNVHFVRRFCKSRNKQSAMTHQQINLNLCKIFTKLIRYNI